MTPSNEDAEIKLPNGVVHVRMVRWWWIDRVAGTWAADVEIDRHGLVSGVPGAWLNRTGTTVPRGRRGRVVSERRESLGERFGPQN